MSFSVMIAVLAIFATLAAAFLQPIAGHWLTPKQKLRLDVSCSRYVIPPAVSREMFNYYVRFRANNTKLQPDFGHFLGDAERYQSFFDITIANTGKAIARNVILECSAYGKYVIVHSRNKSEHHSDEPEYFLGDLQPSEKIHCQIWSTSPFPTYDFAAYPMFSVTDDHNTPKQIVLRGFYDKASHYILERATVRDFASMLKWMLLPPLLLCLIVYVGVATFHYFWPSHG